MKVVVDASVAVKWIFPDPAQEPDADRALELLLAIRDRSVTPLQPPHWLAEVAAVVTRVRPDLAEEALDLLDALELPVLDDLRVLKQASRLSRDLNHHLFDTLYHAVALSWNATLVSADGQYHRKARHLGRLVRLAEWRKPS